MARSKATLKLYNFKFGFHHDDSVKSSNLVTVRYSCVRYWGGVQCYMAKSTKVPNGSIDRCMKRPYISKNEKTYMACVHIYIYI
jgi:hypothetical protein